MAETSSRKTIPLILCAGKGTRMLPLTSATPKPCIPFLNVPLVAYSLILLKRAGFETVGINLHHLADVAQPVIERLCQTFNITPRFVIEETLSGSGGGVRALYEAFDDPDADYLVLNGDTVIEVELRKFIEYHNRANNYLTLMCRPNKESNSVKCLWRDNSNLGTLVSIRDYKFEFGQPEDINWIEHAADFIGVQLIAGHLIETLPEGRSDIVDELYAREVKSGKVAAVRHRGYSVAIESPQILLDATRDILSGKAEFRLAPLPEPVAPGYYIYKPSWFDDKALVDAPILTGINVKVAAGARIGSFVAMDGVEVVDGAKVRNAVLYGMGRVSGEWSNCVAVGGEVATCKVEE